MIFVHPSVRFAHIHSDAKTAQTADFRCMFVRARARDLSMKLIQTHMYGEKKETTMIVRYALYNMHAVPLQYPNETKEKLFI